MEEDRRGVPLTPAERKEAARNAQRFMRMAHERLKNQQKQLLKE
jgi:hypothetical protein